MNTRAFSATVGSALLLIVCAAPVYSDDQTAGELIKKIRMSDADARIPLVHELSRLGAGALEETRTARDSSKDAGVKRSLARAARWQLAAKVTPLLQAGLASQLTFDGQYDSLKKEGDDVVHALLALLADESTDPDVRFAACRGIADTATKEHLPQLRELFHDILLPEGLREEIGILLAIFGDTAAVKHDIARLIDAASAASKTQNPRFIVQIHRALANLYYRIRNYEEAVNRYDKILEAMKTVYETEKKFGVPQARLDARDKEIALYYYNASCSNSLKGDIKKSQKLLKEAVKRHAVHFDNIEKDGDLAPLRKDKSYAEFKKELEKLFETQEL